MHPSRENQSPPDACIICLPAKPGHKTFGSYKYQGEWGLLDHLIVSGNLLQTDAPLSTSEAHADVARLAFLLTEDRKFGGQQPFRTYLGPRYLGGISDHLPVWVEFRLIY